MMRTAKTVLAALATAGAVLTLWATAAQAAVTHPYIGSFGPGGPGTGTFGRVEGVVVEQSTQDVYVYDDFEGGRRIYKFNAAGEPVAFSALASNVIEGVGGAGNAEEELAVDNSSGPAKGDIYVANNGEVLIYNAAGVKLGSLTGGEPCGVAVDGAGHVYVGVYPGTVRQYIPSANPVSNSDYVSSLSGLQGICNVAVDGEGSVYAATYGGGVRKYAAGQFNTSEEPAISIPAEVAFNERGRTLAVDLSSSSLYIDEESAIAEYEDGGGGEPTFVDRFGTVGAQGLGESFGMAVNETSGSPDSGDVYAGSGEGRVYMYGPRTTVADVGLEAATGISASSATMHGTVDPLGIALTACDFEYWIERAAEATSAACSPAPGSGSSPVVVSATIDGLFGNTTYHYRLAVTDGHGASYSEVATFTTLPAAPSVTGQSPTVSTVTRTSALVTPTFDDGNGPSTVLVQFAAEGAYAPGAAEPYADGSSSPVFEVPAASGPQTTRPLPLTGLLPATTYHYRVVVSNAAGTAYSSDYTITTASPTPPALETAPASSVSATTAVLAGVVIAQGLQTSYEFEVGTDASYGGAEIFGNAGQSAGPEAVSASLQFLVPATTYHYRLVATNADGTTYGPDMTFTTTGVAAPIAQPPSAPLIAAPTFQFPTAIGAITNPKGKAKKAKKAKRRKQVKTKRKSRAGHKRKGGGKRQ